MPTQVLGSMFEKFGPWMMPCFFFFFKTFNFLDSWLKFLMETDQSWLAEALMIQFFSICLMKCVPFISGSFQIRCFILTDKHHFLLNH